MPRLRTHLAFLLIGLPLAAQSAPPPAWTLSGSVTAGSQYLWRGITQTDGRPTLQAEFDLAHASGFYASVFMSNISWYTDQNAGVHSNPTALSSPGRVGPPLYAPDKANSAAVELDVYGGWKWAIAKDWTLDAGLYQYLYPGTYENTGAYRRPDTTEAYLGLGYAWASLKVSRTLSSSYMGVAHSDATTYLDLSMSIPLAESGWTLQAHGGRTTFAAHANPDYFTNNGRLAGDNSLFSYSDYRLAAAKEFRGWTFTLALTHATTRSRAADDDATVYENVMGRNIGGTRLSVTVAKSF